MKIISGISISFAALGFTYLATYKHIAARYGLTAILIVMAIWKREFITEKVREILAIRKKN